MTTRSPIRLRRPSPQRVALAALLPCVLGGAAQASPRPSAILAKATAESQGGQIFPSYEATPEGARRAEAPRLVLAGPDGKTELVPLKETSARVRIAGAVAAVEVHQVFENTGTKPIEALYVFPASTRAAVHAMRMKIGARTIEAQIDRKQKARETFEQARQAGQRASLLEEERPNVFSMRVTNIIPKDRIEVTLDYSELLVPEDAVYEFVYPTVVGPRYQSGHDDRGAHDTRWMSSPTLPAGQAPTYTFGLEAHLETGVPLKELSSPSHRIVTSSGGPSSTDVKLDEPAGGNRDFVLRYRLAGDRIESGVLLAPPVAADDGAGTFAVMMEPPRAPKAAELPPREYLFLLDVSGSMHGFPLDTAKELMRNLLPKMRPIDTFDVALFSGAAQVFSPTGSVQATAENIRRALDIIERQQGGGGTELMGGLEMTYRIPKQDPGVSRTVVVVTDGFVGVEAQAYRFVREHLNEANLFAFGIGSSVNRALIEGLARAGLGEPFVVLGTGEAAAQAEKLRKIIQEPVLTHIAVTFKGLETSEVSPAAMPDLLSRRPLILLGQYKGAPHGSVIITGLAGGHTPFRQEIALNQAEVRDANAPLRSLWARRWVTVLEDEHHLSPRASLEEGITQLGLHYHLLTPFTSFVAVDSEIANRSGQTRNVTQPLPLPEGVSQLAAEQTTLAGPFGGLGTIGKGVGGGGRGAQTVMQVRRSAAQGAAQPAAPPPSAAPKKTVAAAEDKADARAVPAAEKAKENENEKKEARPLTRGHVSLVEGWTVRASSAPARAFLAGVLHPGPGDAVNGRATVKLVLDGQGRITEVKLVKGDELLLRYLISVWKDQVVPGAQGVSSLVVQVSLSP